MSTTIILSLLAGFLTGVAVISAIWYFSPTEEKLIATQKILTTLRSQHAKSLKDYADLRTEFQESETKRHVYFMLLTTIQQDLMAFPAPNKPNPFHTACDIKKG